MDPELPGPGCRAPVRKVRSKQPNERKFVWPPPATMLPPSEQDDPTQPAPHGRKPTTWTVLPNEDARNRASRDDLGGRARSCGPKGRRFESCRAYHTILSSKRWSVGC